MIVNNNNFFRFKWSLYKTLEYLNSRRNDLEIKTTFFNVISQIEKLLNPDSLSKKWEMLYNYLYFSLPTTSPEEIIVINTYFNA